MRCVLFVFEIMYWPISNCLRVGEGMPQTYGKIATVLEAFKLSENAPLDKLMLSEAKMKSNTLDLQDQKDIK